MPDIFVSYATADRERVRPVVEALERRGWSVWWDRRILPGQNWDDAISGALETAKCVVVLWTRTSVVSEWVRLEANVGRERGTLAPALLDDVQLPLTFRQIQTASLTNWTGTDTFPELLTLVAGIRAILEGHAPPAVLPQPVTEERALDAALGRELPVDEPANLIAMIRRADSPGLKAILELDDEYGLSGDDVVSKPFELTFSTDAAGRPLPAEILLRVVSPGFNPPVQDKTIQIRAQRDSTVCSFLMTPIEPGHLVVQLELYLQETCVATRILRANGVPTGRAVAVQGRQVVTMPLYVNVNAAELEKLLHTAAAAGALPAQAPAPPPVPAPARMAEMPGYSVPPTAPRPASPSARGNPGAMWVKAGVAAALILICVPVVYFQLWNRRYATPGSIELPSKAESPRPPADASVPTPARPVAEAPPPTPRPQPPPIEPDLQARRERLTLLSRRADSAKASLRELEQQQRAAGLGMNPDLLAAENRMELSLHDAEAAYKEGDRERMEKSLDSAERAIESIEKTVKK
jgi:TIR domain